MAANSSSSQYIFNHCLHFQIANYISIIFLFTKTFIYLPVSVFVLYLGHQRWRRGSFAATSHSDMFSYHAAVMQLVFLCGSTVFLSGHFTGHSAPSLVGMYMSSSVYFGELLLHLLTCADHHLAVVHPVAYLRLKQSGGVRVRNTALGCVWSLSFGWLGVLFLYLPDVPFVPFFCLLSFSLVIVSFCNLSVLCVLIRPGPGEVGGARKQVDQSKQRAFNTITAIMAVLSVYFLGMLLSLALDHSKLLSDAAGCLALVLGSWFSLPSGLVLPLLFLHRAGKLLSCHSSNK